MTDVLGRIAGTFALAAVLAIAWTAETFAQQPYYGGYGSGYRSAPGYGYGHQAYRTPQARQAPRQRAQAGPRDIVRQGVAKVRAFVAEGGADDPLATAAFMESTVAPYFDFDHMAQWAAGARWRGLNEAARSNLTDKLAAHFTGTLAKHLGGYGRAKVRIGKARSGRQRGTVEVPVAVATPQRPQMKLAFRFYRNRAGAWKVYDVEANGQSALMFYRSYFQRISR